MGARSVEGAHKARPCIQPSRSKLRGIGPIANEFHRPAVVVSGGFLSVAFCAPVIPKCANDRSLAIAHDLESFFWIKDSKTEKRVRRTRTETEVSTDGN